LFNQATRSTDYRVRLDDGLPAEQGPFYQRLSTLIRPDDDVFKNFSKAVAGLVTERGRSLTDIIEHAFDTEAPAS
ncbi:MAG: hypothetical protein QOG97_2593, partial [Acidimicrobiaceae bacterium]|nr:hypothetical protein [Acidimicrobiaceae bacterium]